MGHIIGLKSLFIILLDKSQIFAGWNSSTDDIYYIPTFAGQTAATVVRFDSFALFDSLLVFENNTAYVKY